MWKMNYVDHWTMWILYWKAGVSDSYVNAYIVLCSVRSTVVLKNLVAVKKRVTAKRKGLLIRVELHALLLQSSLPSKRQRNLVDL